MGIARFENLDINNVTNSIDDVGQQTTSTTTFNYTPNLKQIVDDQNLYSITWRNRDWRITDVRESNDRMTVLMLCYRNDPTIPV